MRHGNSFLVLSCIFKCIGLVLAKCIASKYGEGYTYRIQCSNVSLDTVLNQSSSPVSAYMIFHSDISQIPSKVFQKQSFSLQSLNMHQCKIMNIDPTAFAGLLSLKSLALPNNNLTEVRTEWFTDLTGLEQLDLSYNHIREIEPIALSRLKNLRRLDIRGNQIGCFDPVALLPMAGIDKFRFYGNPLTLQCRGKLTLWLRDHGVNYQTDESGKESWLDTLSWHCAMTDPKIAESEELLKECVILNMFNQLRTGLASAESSSSAFPTECGYRRNLLTSCNVGRTGRGESGRRTNGEVIRELLLMLRAAKSAV